MHIELTTRCTLACPGCPRTMIANQGTPYPKLDLNLEAFLNFMDCESGRAIGNFNLEGNHGDPIYYPQLVEFVTAFRSKKFVIVTNGSYRDKKFWESLASVMTKDDWIIFSIDGLEHNNHLYRHNSNWQSIMCGIDIMARSSANIGWKTIVFDYNYQEIDAIKKFAESKGAVFVSQKTNRFGDESLRPPVNYVEVAREYTPELEKFTAIEPQCDQHRREYVAADGYYWPCCWISSSFTLTKSEIWQQRSQWTIADHTLDHLRQRLANWIPSMKSNPDIVCRMMCRPGVPRWPYRHGLT